MTILEAALEYARSGFCVVPLCCRGKHMIKGKVFSTPTTDEDIIRYWWKQIPNANLGLPTSMRRNNLIIIDIDIKNGTDGRKSLEQFLIRHGIEIPDTSIVKTGSGGYHLYYRNFVEFYTTGGKNILPGVDVRAENAHVVAPPSIHENGNVYQWIKGDINNISNVNDELIKFLIQSNLISSN